MTVVQKLGRLDRIILTRLGRLWRRWVNRPQPVSGLPDGLPWLVVDKVCRELLGSPLQKAAHVHLSGWKQAGAFRVYVRAVNGRSHSLIYKNAIYTESHIPALADFPVCPGLPEFLAYSSETLQPYIPAVYLAQELVPGHHYRYLLEDLGRWYEPLSRNQARQLRRRYRWVLQAVSALPKVHERLFWWAGAVGESSLIRYDQAFADALTVYIWTNLTEYLEHVPETAVSVLMDNWITLARLLIADEFHDPARLQPIHGDFHVTNIYIQRRVPFFFKLIDWEWAGIGLPHTDLATLLNRAPVSVEQDALAVYAAQNTAVSLAQHRRLYEWCQLERGLMDIAFLARQQLYGTRPVTWIPAYIHQSALRVQRAVNYLTGGAPLAI